MVAVQVVSRDREPSAGPILKKDVKRLGCADLDRADQIAAFHPWLQGPLVPLYAEDVALLAKGHKYMNPHTVACKGLHNRRRRVSVGIGAEHLRRVRIALQALLQGL